METPSDGRRPSIVGHRSPVTAHPAHFCGLVLTSFMFLAVLLVLFLSLLFILHLYISSTLPSPKPHGIFSLPAAYTSFSSYLSLSNAELTRMRASYASISHSHKKLGYSIGYPAKLNRLAEIYQRNAKITRAIAALAELQFPNELGKSGGSGVNSPWWWGSWFTNRTTSQFASTASLVRVRESLKHFVRDWSTDGATERKVIFTPVLDVLRYLSSSSSSTSSTSSSAFVSGPYKSLLIPGSGLSRLAYESSLLGFHTTACELSMFMNLAFRFLLDESTTSQINQHEVHPYAHWLSHQRVSWQDDSESAFRSVRFPDVVPSLRDAEVKGGSLELVEGDFLTLSKPQQQHQHPGQHPIDPNSNFPSSSFPSPPSKGTGTGRGNAGYDILLTLFFIDTSPNILSTLSHIHHLLRPGGIWINLGPLLYTSSGSGGGSRLELSLDEIVRVGRGLGMDVVGFEGMGGRRR
ncbi:N2227-domain-containing protein, partial [Dendrothele bispora CBS 962.96]